MKLLREQWIEIRMMFAKMLFGGALMVAPARHPDSRALLIAAEWFLKETKETKGTKN